MLSSDINQKLVIYSKEGKLKRDLQTKGNYSLAHIIAIDFCQMSKIYFKLFSSILFQRRQVKKGLKSNEITV